MRVVLAAACLLASGIFTLRAAGPVAASSDWTRKIDPRIIAEAARDSAAEMDCLIILNEQADLGGAERLATMHEKGKYVYERLTEMAARTQPAVLASLAGQDVFVEPAICGSFR